MKQYKMKEKKMLRLFDLRVLLSIYNTYVQLLECIRLFLYYSSLILFYVCIYIFI